MMADRIVVGVTPGFKRRDQHDKCYIVHHGDRYLGVVNDWRRATKSLWSYGPAAKIKATSAFIPIGYLIPLDEED